MFSSVSARKVRGSRLAILLTIVMTAVIAPAQEAGAAVVNGFEKYRNQVSISYDPTSGACFDDAVFGGPACTSFSGVALLLAGVTAGAEVELDGINFAWPDTASGEPDSMSPDGQVIKVKAPPGTNTLGLLGACETGPLGTEVVLTYKTPNAEGSLSDKESVSVPDWWNLTGTPGSPAANEIRTPFQIYADAVPVAVPVSVWAFTVPVDPSRRLVSISFPDSNSHIRFFDFQLVKL